MKYCKHEILRSRKYIKCGKTGAVRHIGCYALCPFYKKLYY